MWQRALQFLSDESMNDFHKCKCPHCGQSIEYPAEGMGQVVPCPTCEQTFTLLPDITIPRKASTEPVLPSARNSTSQNQSENRLSSMMDEFLATNHPLRSFEPCKPATNKQKEKIQWFGCAIDKNLTKGAASELLDKLVKRNPERNQAYYNRPPTEKQLERMRLINEEAIRVDGEPYYDLEKLTYGEAKDIIQDDDLAEQRERREEAEKKLREYEQSEDGRIDDEQMKFNGYGIFKRDITRQEMAHAWSLVKSRNGGQKTIFPNGVKIFIAQPGELTAALKELYPDLE